MTAEKNNTAKRFVRDDSGMFQALYTDTISGLNFGILTVGRGKRRRNVWHIFDGNNYSFSKIVPSFKAAKTFLSSFNHKFQTNI